MTWQRFEEPTWRSRPIVWLEIAGRDVLLRRLGEPSGAGDVSHFGPAECWLVRFDCGLELSLVWYFGRWDLPAGVEIYANRDDDPDHIVDHVATDLGIPIVKWGRSSDEPPPLAAPWSIIRQDDNGNRAVVARTTSRCEADHRAAEFEARGHKQIYWVEPAD